MRLVCAAVNDEFGGGKHDLLHIALLMQQVIALQNLYLRQFSTLLQFSRRTSTEELALSR